MLFLWKLLCKLNGILVTVRSARNKHTVMEEDTVRLQVFEVLSNLHFGWIIYPDEPLPHSVFDEIEKVLYPWRDHVGLGLCVKM